MNQDPSLASWSDHMPEQSLISVPGEEFSNLLDFDFDLTELENAVNQDGQAITTSASQMPTTMVQENQVTGMEGIQTTPSQQYAASFGQTSQIGMQAVHSTQPQMSQTHYYVTKHQQQLHHGAPTQSYGQPYQFVPPTPNSTELHGAVAQYPPPIDTGSAQRRYEPYTRASDDQVCVFCSFPLRR